MGLLKERAIEFVNLELQRFKNNAIVQNRNVHDIL
jgi:hypothetical protein